MSHSFEHNGAIRWTNLSLGWLGCGGLVVYNECSGAGGILAAPSLRSSAEIFLGHAHLYFLTGLLILFGCPAQQSFIAYNPCPQAPSWRLCWVANSSKDLILLPGPVFCDVFPLRATCLFPVFRPNPCAFSRPARLPTVCPYPDAAFFCSFPVRGLSQYGIEALSSASYCPCPKCPEASWRPTVRSKLSTPAADCRKRAGQQGSRAGCCSVGG